MVLINAFEVPIEADEQLITGWERARDFLAAREGFAETALHRAIREDVDFRFVNVAQVKSAQAWREAVGDPDFPGGEMPFRSHASLYEVIHDEGAVDGSDGVMLINLFEVPPDVDESFLADWNKARAFLGAQRGYLGTRLHRSPGSADFRFVNVARWSSPLMFARAVQRPEFQESAGALPFKSHTALYDVIRR